MAVVIGCAFGTFFMAFHSTQGPQLGLPQMIQSRPQFGYVGALLVWCVALVTLVGYCSFNLVLSADTVSTLVGWNRPMTMVLVGVLATVLAILGYDLIHRAQRVLAYVLIAVFVVMTHCGGARALSRRTARFACVSHHTVPDPAVRGGGLSGVLVDLGIRLFALLAARRGRGGVLLVDVCGRAVGRRLADADRHGRGGAVSGAGADHRHSRRRPTWSSPDPARPFLIVSLLGLVTITTIMYYSASLTLLSVADSFRPLRPTVRQRVATLGLLLAISGTIALSSSAHFAEQFGHFLEILLYLFTPWTAINLIDFYFVRRGLYSVREIFNPNGMYGRWSWRGLVAYFGGFAAMIPFFSTGFYTGPVARALGGADVAMLVGLPVSAAIYLLACRSLDLAREARIIAVADRGLDPDA